MGGLRILALSVLSLLPAVPARAADDPLWLLADCAGRYGAVVEHLWLVDGAAADAAALRRDQFRNMLAALPADLAAVALNRRIETRAAHRALLDRALFGPDPRASLRASALLATCDRLLPSS